MQEAARINNSYILLKADCDNDGRTDLVGQMYGHSIGGTSGNADYIFLKGQPGYPFGALGGRIRG